MDANLVVTQFSSTAMFVWGFQQLKNAPWFPVLIQKGQIVFKRIISVAGAFLIHGGIGYVWDPKFDANGYRHLDLAIPSAAVLVVTMWHVLGQYVMQESWFQVIYNRLGMTTSSHASGPTLPAQVTAEGKIVTPEVRSY
jgi:predicted small integral membrane protein